MPRVNFKHFVLVISLLTLLAGCASDSEKKENFLTEAQTFYQNQEYDNAIIQLKNAIKIDSAFSKAHLLLAKCYLKTNDIKNAFNTYLLVEKLIPDNPEVKLELATAYLSRKEIDQAKTRVDKVLDTNPENVRALYLRADILSTQGSKLAKIQDIYEKIIKIDTTQTLARTLLSKIYLAKKEYNLSERTLKEAVQFNPEDPQAYKGLFGFYMFCKNFKLAESTLKDWVNKNKNKADPYILLGNFYMDTGKINLAEDSFIKAMKIDPKNINSYMLLSRIYNSTGEKDKAEALIQKAIHIDPENITIKNTYADFHLVN